MNNMKAQFLIKCAVYEAHKKGFLPRDHIGIMDERDPDMVMEVCRMSKHLQPSEIRWVLVLFSSLDIPIHSGHLEESRQKLTPEMAETMAELINWYVKFFNLNYLCDDEKVSPDDVLQEIKEIMENLRAYS